MNARVKDSFDGVPYLQKLKNNKIILKANWIDIENKNIWNPFNTEIEQIKSIGNRIGNDNNVYGYKDGMNIYLYYYDDNNSNTCYII